MTDRPIKIKTADGWQDLAIQGPQGPVGPVGPNGLELIYKYTVTGSDKASIDTAVDTADAGTLDWTNGDVLEIFVMGRTDETVILSPLNILLNNDSSAHYDVTYISTIPSASTLTSDAGTITAQSAIQVNIAGASAGANCPGVVKLECPTYAGTTFYKFLKAYSGVRDGISANSHRQDLEGNFQFRSTSAITRLSVSPATADKKLKVGTQLLIYKRTTNAGSIDGGSP